jgi:phage tail sheath gpL-like
MAALVFVVIAALLVGVLVTVAARSGDTLAEVDRFHKARAMTTEWAKAYTGAPAQVADPDTRRPAGTARGVDDDAHQDAGTT